MAGISGVVDKLAGRDLGRVAVFRMGFMMLSGVASAAPSLSPPDAEPIAPGLSYDPREADLPIAVRLDDGVEFKTYYLTDLEFGSFAESAPGGQAAGLRITGIEET